MKLDSRPKAFDLTVNPDHDSASLLVAGFPSGFLDGATATAPLRSSDRSVVTPVGAWDVAVDETTITLSLTRSALAALGSGAYPWSLQLELASGGEPPTIGGTLTVSRSFAQRWESTSASFVYDSVGATITIEQVVAVGIVVIDGGSPGDTDQDVLDGGTPS